MSKNLLINANDMSIFEPRRYYQEYEGTFITATDKSEDDTLDTSRYIEVTEIWGNTWQDSDGKNLFDEKSLSSTTYPERRTISYIGNKIVVNNLIEYSYVRELHDISINLKAGTYTLSLSNVENTNNNYCAVMLGLDNETIVTISASDKIKYKTFTVSSDCNVTVETNVLGTYIGEIKFNVQLEEGAKATEYEPYYKADLSDIKSVGELYVDDEGQPILDDLGREQYKIEIESCNKNLSNINYVIGYIDANHPLDTDFRFSISLSDLTEYIPPQSHKTTILLPCQLQKVGDVYDRLYWDSEKGRYVVEKNVVFNIINGSETFQWKGFDSEISFMYSIKNNYNLKPHSDLITSRIKYLGRLGYSSTMTFRELDMELGLIFPKGTPTEWETNTVAKYNKWIQEENVKIYGISNTSQLIETNITEKIQLPCYSEKTHIFVNSTVDATMKVLVPYKEII